MFAIKKLLRAGGLGGVVFRSGRCVRQCSRLYREQFACDLAGRLEVLVLMTDGNSMFFLWFGNIDVSNIGFRVACRATETTHTFKIVDCIITEE